MSPGEDPVQPASTDRLTGACVKCGKPTTLFDGTTWAHSSVFDMLVCTEAKAIPGGPAKMSAEEFADRMARRSLEALRTKDMGTT